jgi:hypothetical protein
MVEAMAHAAGRLQAELFRGTTRSLTDDLHEGAFTAFAVEFAVEDLLPRTEVEPPATSIRNGRAMAFDLYSPRRLLSNRNPETRDVTPVVWEGG